MTFSQAWLEARNHLVDVWAAHGAAPMLIGRLSYDVQGRAGYFEWDQNALASGVERSPIRLPLSSGVWSSAREQIPVEYNGLPGMLNDALPDGWGLYLLDKALARLAIKPEHITPALRLAYLGERAWGGLTFRPVIEDAPDEAITLERLGEEVEATIEGHIEYVSDELLRAGSSPQGARPKVMVDLSDNGKTARATGGAPRAGFSSWLIKFAARDETEDAPIVEQAYMQIARDAGLDVMESVLMTISGRPAFATRRFDRLPGGRVFCHTLGGLLHFSHRAPGLDYGHVAGLMDSLGVPDAAYAQAYRRAVFNAALSVRDDHAKNFAFVLNEFDQWDLSPAYDLTYMEGPGGYHTMTFDGGNSKDPTRDDLLRLAQYYRLGEEDASRIIGQVLDAAAGLTRCALDSGASRKLMSTLTKRLDVIATGLRG